MTISQVNPTPSKLCYLAPYCCILKDYRINVTEEYLLGITKGVTFEYYYLHNFRKTKQPKTQEDTVSVVGSKSKIHEHIHTLLGVEFQEIFTQDPVEAFLLSKEYVENKKTMIAFFDAYFLDYHPQYKNTHGQTNLVLYDWDDREEQLLFLVINTNGFQTEVIVEQIKDVYKLLPKKTKLWVYVSLDAVNNIAERIRGVKDAHRKAINTIFSLKQLQLELAGFKIGLSCTITSQNYDQLNSVYQFAVENDIYSDFIYASVNTAYINSEPNKDLFVLSDSQRATVISFFENLLSYEKLGSSKEYYEYLLNTLNGITTNRSCIFREKRGLLLEADGNVRLCGMADKSLLGNLQDQEIDDILRANVEFMNEVCSSCQTDSYFSWTREAQESISNEMFENLVERKKRGS